MARPTGAERRVAAVAPEFSGVRTGDRRLDERVGKVVAKLAAKPAAGFPTAIGDEGQVEGLYRLFRNSKVTLWKLLKPHIGATVDRVASSTRDVIVIHDSSECAFGGLSKRRGLGSVTSGQGFLLHAALAVELGEQPMPLGILGVETHFRRDRAKKRTSAELRSTPAAKRESSRWKKLVTKTTTLLEPSQKRVIHVMDREADDYLLLEMLSEQRFVIRSRHNRNVTPQGCSAPLPLTKVLADMDGETFRDVRLSKRRPHTFGASKKLEINQRFPAREARLATLKYRVGTVALQKPSYLTADSAPRELIVNVVQVYEPKPPKNEQRIEWTLLTSESVSTEEEVARVVDIYRARWLIEELFKALKTGCAYESRQLESAHALMNALGVFLPIAWSLLRLRAVSRTNPAAPATAVLTEVQLKLLPHLFDGKPPPIRNAGEAMLAVAQRAGHFKHNGPPGWQTLARGFEDLLIAEIGYRVAKAEK
jgi:hypothetical protein